jgi:hypothetical protein
MRKLQPNTHRPFKLVASRFVSHLAFYICNLMLYWCGFEVLWKLDIALIIGLVIHMIYYRHSSLSQNYPLYWFVFYMGSILTISYLGSFGGIGVIQFPIDLILIAPLSILVLALSQKLLSHDHHKEIICEVEAII